MVRTGPDVEEDQRPEVDDRETVAVDRALRALGDEVVHDGEEAGREEEAHGIVPVPPLHHRVLNAGPDDVGFGREQRYRNRGIVAQMQHRNGQDEGEIEPVGDVDVRLAPPHDGAEKDEKVDDPHHREPEICVPFRLGIFLALGDAEQISGAGNDNEEVVAQHDEPGRDVAGKPGAAGALHDIERGGDQDIASECKDHGRCVQRPDASERKPRQVEVEHGKGKLERGP